MDVKELFDLAGKVALVTDGTDGLGLEIAQGLGEAGAAVAVTARREEGLESAGAEFRAQRIQCLALTCDVSQPSQVEAAVAATIERFGRIDVLVNNTGIGWAEPSQTLALDQWHSVLEANVTGCFLMSQAAGRAMILGGRGGAIINIAPITAPVGTAPGTLDALGDSASQGAIIGLTRDLAVKWAQHAIRVNAIAPGFFDTTLTTRALEGSRSDIERATPMNRIGRAGELKGVALFLASAASDYITGQVLAVDGGATAW
jgi:gluconate 5-dehydrogenase